MKTPCGRTTVVVLMLFALLATACTVGAPPPAGRPAAASAAAASGRAAAPSAAVPAASASAPAPQALQTQLLGKLALTPAHGPWGTQVTASATGLGPQTTYNLAWTTVKGDWELSADRSEYKGRKYAPVQVPLASVTTDGSGAFSARFTVPQGFGFQHDLLVLEGATVLRNQAGFDVDLQIEISPKSGPVGTPITIEARGIGWRQMENSWLLSYDNDFTGWLSSVTTAGAARAVVPATGAPGVHILTILHGDFTFPYLNMQQSPSPNRPQFRIPFTVTEGPAVLPAKPAQQVLPVLAAKPIDKGIWAAPASGLVGERATLTGRALPSNSDVSLVWTTMEGNRVATGYDEVTKTLGQVRTDGTGAFVFAFTVPNDLGGAHKVTAKVGEQVVGQTAFTLQPNAFPLATEHGPSGSEVVIHLLGVGWTETANIFHLVYDNSYVGYACGFNSGGDVTVNFVMSGERGWHYLDLYPGIYKGVETRPLNFRVPQLTFADDHPGEVLPAFHYAFLID